MAASSQELEVKVADSRETVKVKVFHPDGHLEIRNTTVVADDEDEEPEPEPGKRVSVRKLLHFHDHHRVPNPQAVSALAPSSSSGGLGKPTCVACSRVLALKKFGKKFRIRYKQAEDNQKELVTMVCSSCRSSGKHAPSANKQTPKNQQQPSTAPSSSSSTSQGSSSGPSSSSAFMPSMSTGPPSAEELVLTLELAELQPDSIGSRRSIRSMRGRASHDELQLAESLKTCRELWRTLAPVLQPGKAAPFPVFHNTTLSPSGSYQARTCSAEIPAPRGRGGLTGAVGFVDFANSAAGVERQRKCKRAVLAVLDKCGVYEVLVELILDYLMDSTALACITQHGRWPAWPRGCKPASFMIWSEDHPDGHDYLLTADPLGLGVCLVQQLDSQRMWTIACPLAHVWLNGAVSRSGKLLAVRALLGHKRAKCVIVYDFTNPTMTASSGTQQPLQSANSTATSVQGLLHSRMELQYSSSGQFFGGVDTVPQPSQSSRKLHALDIQKYGPFSLGATGRLQWPFPHAQYPVVHRVTISHKLGRSTKAGLLYWRLSEGQDQLKYPGGTWTAPKE